MKVKILSAQNDVIHLLVDGTPYSFLVGTARPLTPKDLRAYFDRQMLTAMQEATGVLVPHKRSGFVRFIASCMKRKSSERRDVTVICRAVVAWIRKSAVPLEVEGASCLVLTPEMLERLETGELEL